MGLKTVEKILKAVGLVSSVFVFGINAAQIPLPQKEIFSLNSSPFFRNHSEQTGMPSAEINRIRSDSRGFVWFCTPNGLVRYNGIQYRYFIHNPADSLSLRDNWCEDLCETPDGRIWVGTGNGLSVFNTITEQFKPFSLGDILEAPRYRKDITALYYDSLRGNLLMGDVLGFYSLNLKSGRIRHYNIFENDRYYHKVVSFFRDAENRLWISALNYGYYLWDEIKDTVLKAQIHTSGEKSFYVQALYASEPLKGCLYLSTWGAGILKVLDVKGADVTVKKINWRAQPELEFWSNIAASPILLPPWSNDSIAYFSSAENGIGTLNLTNDSVFFIQRNERLISSYLAQGAKHAHFAANYLWFGFYKGVSQYGDRQQYFKLFEMPKDPKSWWGQNDLYYPEYACADPKNPSVFWLVTQKGIAGRWEPDKRQFEYFYSLHLQKPRLFMAAREIHIVGQIALLFTDFGIKTLDYINNKEGNPVNFQNLITLNPKKLIPTKEGFMLAITTRRGIYRYNPANDTYSILSESPKHPNGVNSAVLLKNGRLAIASTHHGILLADTATRKIIDEPEVSKSYNSILCSYQAIEDEFGRIWAATGSGLFYRNPYQFSHTPYFNPIDGTNNGGQHIGRDAKGNIWYLSRSMLSRIEPSSMRAENFKVNSGFENTHFFGLQAVNDSNYFIYSENKFYHFNPLQYRSEYQAPQLLVDEIAINNEKIDESIKEIILKSNQKSLKISFFSSSFDSNNELEYNIKINNRNGNVLEFSKPSIELSYLKPGEYYIEAQVSNTTQTWESNTIRYIIRVLPPWYSQSWAIVLWILLTILTVIIIFNYRLKQAKKTAQEKALVDKTIAELEMKTFRSQMNPHFIFNSLNSIQSFILNNNKLEASDYLARFSRMIRLVLESSVENQSTLEQEKDLLINYLELEKLRTTDKFNYEINIDKKLDGKVKIPSMLSQPYIENAIWHGIAGLDKQGKLNISYTLQGGYCVCLIEDNGIGRAEAGRRQGKKAGSHVSRGMSITEQRLRYLNPVNPGSVEINDIKNELGQICGTRVIIKIPLNET